MTRAKRVLFVMLAFALVAGLMACGTSTTPPAESASSTSSASQASASQPAASEDGAGAEQLYEEHLTVTAMLFMESFTSDLVKDDVVSKYIMDKFNITLEIIEGGGESAWVQKAPTLIAGGDLPDIFLLFNQGGTGIQGMMQTLLDANAIENLEPWIEKGALPALTDHPYMKAAIEYQRQMISPDGNLYAIPSCVGSFDTPKNPVVANSIRWDVYEQIGKPEITDMDTFLDVLKQMQDAYPQTPDGQGVYAVSGWFGDNQGWNQWCINGPFNNPMGINGGEEPVFGYIHETSLSPVDNYREDGSPFWQRVEWYYRANQMGILDPDSWTMMQDNWIQKVEDGRILYIQPGWEPSQRNPILESKFGADVGFVSLPPFPDVESYVYLGWNLGGERYYSIPSYSDEKVKERVIAMANWMCTEEGAMVANNGPEGMAWETRDGKAVVIDEAYAKAGQYDNDMRHKYGANVYHHFKGFADFTWMLNYQAPANLRFSAESVASGLTNCEKKALEHFGASSFDDENYFGRVFNVSLFPLRTSIPVLPEDLLRERTAINDIVYRYEFEMIQAKDDAEYARLKDAFISEINNTAYDEIRKWSYDHEAEIAAKLVEITDPLKEALGL